MKKELFDRLVTSIKRAGKIRRGEEAPSRRFDVTPLDIKKLRRPFTSLNRNSPP